MHFVNDYLAAPEKNGIPQDISTSVHEINDSLNHLETSLQGNDEIPNKVIGRCTRLIKVHHTMKYPFDVRIIIFCF